MYTHPRGTTDSIHPATLTVSNGHTNGRAVEYNNGHANSYATGYANGNANGHSKEKLDNPVIVMRRPNPLEYPFITVKAVQVVRARRLFVPSDY